MPGLPRRLPSRPFGVVLSMMFLLGEPAQAQDALTLYGGVPRTLQSTNHGGMFFGRKPNPEKVRRYFVAAEPELWDYAPSGQDVICGKPLAPLLSQNRRAAKLRYFAYTDDTFQTRARQESSLGILGPVLRGVVGDYLVITFFNRTSRPLSMHPHGVRYDKDSEGSFSLPNPGAGSLVGSQEKFTYVWYLDESSGPLPGEPSSKGWLYHSHVQSDYEIGLGLIGLIVVTDPHRAGKDGNPKDVDRELATLFMIFDDSEAAGLEEAYEYGGNVPKKSWAQLRQSSEEQSRYALNGRVFGNLTGLEMNDGERVRWYAFALGSERDIHTAHWHGLRVIEDGRRRTDVVELLPASLKIADFTADNPGTWLFHCHVAEHMMEGMFANMIVHARATPANRRARLPGTLGHPENLRSLQILSAQATSTNEARQFTFRITASATVYDAFSLAAQPIEFAIAGNRVKFQPDLHGQGRAANATFQAVGDNNFGVVYGGLLNFELTLSGPEWQAVLMSVPASKPIPLTVNIGQAHHEAEIVFRR